MRAAQVRPDGALIRWVEIPGPTARTRLYLHGLGASSGPYFTASAVHPALAGTRSLLMDLLGFGISDRPTELDYTLEDHADAVAAALTAYRPGKVRARATRGEGKRGGSPVAGQVLVDFARCRADRRFIARRSSSFRPPHTPASCPASRAHWRHSPMTGQRRHTALASSIWSSAGPEVPIGKKSSGSSSLHAAR